MNTKELNKALMFSIGVALILLLTGCEDAVNSQQSNRVESTAVDGLREVRVNGCQYLVFENGIRGGSAYAFSMTHKGNCDNPIHNHKQ